jgi:hypothetical protein
MAPLPRRSEEGSGTLAEPKIGLVSGGFEAGMRRIFLRTGADGRIRY